MKPTLEELEQLTLSEDDFSEVPPADIVAYNELRSCADLFRMHKQGILDVQPEFQRDVVWKGPDQTRFIDSLVKQLPIPSMCFAFDHKAQRWMVIDGLQRISTIVKFLKGGDWRLSKLEDIDQELAGKSVAEIADPDSKLNHFHARVENLSVPITVLRCDFSKKVHMEYLFTIFHRLNTGGTKLNNQEIRNCIYGGSFNGLLKELDKYSHWRKLNKMAAGNNYRFTKQEIMLRFFAFSDRHKKYEGHLAKFLNSYMHEHENATEQWLAEKRRLFKRVVDYAYEQVFESKAPPKLPISLLEALLVAIGKNIDALEKEHKNSGPMRYKKLQGNALFSENSLREGLSKKPRVIERFDAAVQLFSAD